MSVNVKSSCHLQLVIDQLVLHSTTLPSNILPAILQLLHIVIIIKVIDIVNTDHMNKVSTDHLH